MQCDMQSTMSRIWTRVAVSVFYADVHYTMGTWKFIDECIEEFFVLLGRGGFTIRQTYQSAKKLTLPIADDNIYKNIQHYNSLFET